MTCKALIVSDDPNLISEIVDALASLEHEYDTACSQGEALKRLKANRYDYVLSGISIPARAQNGKARIQNTENMLDQLAGLRLKQSPPVILMSDYAAAGVEETADAMRLAISMHRQGVADIIAKPFPDKGRTLDRVIKKVLAGKVDRVRITWPEAATAEPAKDGADGEKWLTVTQAAKLLARDLPSLDIRKARSRISTAASRGEFKTTGSRRSRRVEPVSFDAWRLKQRDRDLDEEDVA